MIKKLIICALLMLTGLAASAAVPARVKAAAKQIATVPTTQVKFLCNGRPGTMVLGDGGKFAIDLGDMKLFYDGKTQWAYSAADKEVTILEPTPEELALGNPASVLASLGSEFTGVKVKGETYRLTPVKRSGDIAEVTVGFPVTGVWPQSMTVVAAGGTLSIADMKFTQQKTKRPVSTFQFKAPAGTTITDLR